MEELIRLRHELHRNPELSGKERETGKRIRFYLSRYSPDELYTGIAGEGMAAVFKGKDEGPTILFRCDLDALPIHETSKTSYTSINPGVSHACGHDGHMAMVSGLANRIKSNPLKRGRVILFYQPEEENGTGALKSVRRLRELNLYPDMAFAIHNMPKHKKGNIILAEHTFAAASKGLIVKLIGKASHAAYPENGINPSFAIAEIIQGINEIASLPHYSSFVLITIVHIRVGEIAFGTSPGYGELMCTLRAYSDTDMSLLTDRTIELVKKSGIKHGVNIEFTFTNIYPSAVCDNKLTEEIKLVCKQNGLPFSTIEKPNRWSEDFSHFLVRGPGVIMGLGAGEDQPDLHSPDFDFPDDIIPYGMNVMDGIITKHLR